MENLSFIGAGELLLAPKGTGKFLSVLNLASLKIEPETDDKTLTNTMTGGGGSLDIYTDVKSVKISLGSISQYSQSNVALLTKGTASIIAGGVVADEPVVAYAGFLSKTAKIIDKTKPVTISKGAVEIPAAAYEVMSAGIRFLAPVAGYIDGDTLDVSYTALETQRVAALTEPSQEYEALFIGLNKADNGAPVVVHGFRLRLGVGGLDLLSESNDFAKSDLSGQLLVDTSRTGTGVSQYFNIDRA